MGLRCALLVAGIFACATPAPVPRAAPPPPRPEVTLVRVAAKRHAGVTELVTMATAQDEGIRLGAVRALGRIGGDEAITALIGIVDAGDDRRTAAITALGISGDARGAEHLARLAATLSSADERSAAIWGLGRSGGTEQLATLVAALGDPNVAVGAVALGLYGRRKVPLDDSAREALVAMSESDDRRVRFAAAYALAREHAAPNGEAELAALAQMVEDREADVRAIALFGLNKRRFAEQDLLVTALDDADWRVRVQAVRGLAGTSSSSSMREALAEWTAERAMRAVGATPIAGDNHPLLESLTLLTELAAEQPVRAMYESVYAEATASLAGVAADRLIASTIHCITAAARVRFGAPLADLEQCGGEGGWPPHERKRLASALVKVGMGGTIGERLAMLQRLATDSDPRVRATAIAAALTSEDEEARALAEPLSVAALRDESSTVVAGTIADTIASEGIELTPALRDALITRARAEAEGDPEIRLTLMSALRTADARDARDVFVQAAADPNVTLRDAAREALTAMFPDEALPVAEIAAPAMPPVDPAKVLGREIHWILETTRGEIVIELQPAVAPWNVAALVHLAEGGFYSDLLWHRVVPDFVVQGGDPGGSGWGGPGFVLPGEPSALPFGRGAVGIADAGLDTGGSQIFIMHSRAPHLEGRYTRVGQVIDGMGVVDDLLVGDRILTTRVEYP